MFYYTYRVTNLLDGRYYIGVHSHSEPVDHSYYGSGIRIKRAIEKHGRENFTLEVLQYHSTEAAAYEHEKQLLTEEVLSDEKCYNLNVGGHGGSKPGHVKNKIWHRSPKSKKTKQKISKTLIGKSYITEEGRNRISVNSRGNTYAMGMTYTHTEEAREKISRSRIGIKFSDIHKERISISRRGLGTGSSNAMSRDENRKKVAESKIGRKMLVHPNTGSRKLVKPDTDQWKTLIAEGYLPKD